MSRGWTVFTFGFAFLAPLHIFGKVSAKLNPAMCLAQWVWGNITGVDFVCLSLAEFAGAFVGEQDWAYSSCSSCSGSCCVPGAVGVGQHHRR
jgi:glycerol uptake facilitator-like aquaporin